MKIHRAVTLALMLLMALLLLLGSVSYAVANFRAQSLLSLGIVLIVSALAGIAFSWSRYFPRRR